MKIFVEQSGYENQNNIELFLDASIEELVDGKLITTVFNEYSNDYKQLPNGLATTNPHYNEIKGNFYKKYYDVAIKCRDIIKSINVSGYGRTDYLRLRYKDMCNRIDYSFPYGWKQFAEAVEQ